MHLAVWHDYIEETTSDSRYAETIPVWQRNVSAHESNEQNLPVVFDSDNDNNDDVVTTGLSPRANWLNKRLVGHQQTCNLRSTLVHHDKRTEESWAFLRHVPEIQTNHLSPLSRCQSLLSTSTLSSRNSSTRSTKSLTFDSADDRDDPTCLLPDCHDNNCERNAHRIQPMLSPSQSLSNCPVITCDSNIDGFLRDSDRTRHILKHFTGILQCNFCADKSELFSKAPDRVNLLLTHMVKHHGVKGHPSSPVYTNRKAMKEMRGIDGSAVANCSVCTEPFTAQAFHDHLPGCILRQVFRDQKMHIEKEGAICAAKTMLLDTVPIRNPHESETIENFPSEQHLEPSIQYATSDPIDRADVSNCSRSFSLSSSQAGDSSDEETDWTEEQTSRESSPGASQLSRRLSPTKRKVVETIMQEFLRLSNSNLKAHTAAGGGSSSQSYNGGWSSNASIYSTCSSASRKRSFSGSGMTPPNDGDGDDSKKRRRSNSNTDSRQLHGELRFACPYYKRNPGRHQTFTSCRDPGFTTISRLKEHLYRRHLLPPQCHRCCATFSTDLILREHQRDPSGCEVREQVPVEGFDKDQEQQLKSKKRSQTYLTEEEKWKAVYRILFPDDRDEDMPTPYIEYQPCIGQAAETSNITSFQEFSRLELPRLVRRTLEVVVEQEAQPFEDKLKERLVDIVKECQAQLVSTFQGITLGRGQIDPSSGPAVNIPAPGSSNMSVSDHAKTTHEKLTSLHGYQKGEPSNTTALSKLPMPVAARTSEIDQKVISSNSSDSGYDSAWPSANAFETYSDDCSIDRFHFTDMSECIDLGNIWRPLESQLEPQNSAAIARAAPELTNVSNMEQNMLLEMNDYGTESLFEYDTSWHVPYGP